MKISDIRIDYALKSLNVEDVQNLPLEQFKIWFEEALEAKVLEVNAMNLATVQKDGTPNSRIVLLKGIEDGLIFFTNYQSTKGSELAQNPNVAVTFFWAELERQVRFLGKVDKISPKDSDEYFFSRPFSSQVGAWVSPQSTEIADRDFLENKEQELSKSLDPETIKRPEHWGGYRIKIHEAEFWQGRPSRLHDRILYRLSATGGWTKVRLAP